MTTTLDDDGASTSFWNRAPRVASLTSIVWLAALMIAFSNTGISWPLSMAFLVSGAALLGWWLLRFIIAAIRLRNRSLIRKAAHFWTVVPLCLVFGMGISLSSIPLMVRLYFSADALVASAPALASVPESELFEHNRRAGLFRVREFTQFDRELRFKTSECGLVDTCGLVYSPDGPPHVRGEDTFQHLYGPWWHWYQSW